MFQQQDGDDLRAALGATGQEQDAEVMAEGVESVEGVLVEEELPVAVGEGAADQLDGIPEGLADVQVLAGGVGVVGGYGRGARCEVVEACARP